ncbi:protein of unknown function [Variovorax sp. OK605]|uniref:DUF4123 domain-containing protein n=1 Tax=Variovorax sp. OK605 TaxID=1855317 RepID=UPI0008EF519F|nr:DUF4123 domain-containing protein [Variovorax sp. OK605]SFP40862.1 protein of unknown function [Variovorax sp. OK605]
MTNNNSNALSSPGIVDIASARFQAVLLRSMLAQIDRLLCAERTTRPAQALPMPMRHYALVSAGQCEEGAVSHMVAMHELVAERLFMQTPEAEMADIGPWLIEMPTAPSASLRRSLAHQAAAQAVTLLGSPLRLPKLCEHLRGFLSGTLPDGSPVLLRYFDPRIGFDMLAHWPAAAQRQFTQPLAWWAGWDGDARLRYVKGAAPADIAPPAPPPPSPPSAPSNAALELPAEWVQAMDKAGEANLVVALLAEELETSNPNAANRLAQMHPSLRRQIAQAALAFAHRAGLTGWHNKAQACRQALLTHARFHAHPGFLDTLSGAPAPLDLREVLARVPLPVQQEWTQDRDAMLARLYDAQSSVLLAAISSSAAASLPGAGPGAC